MGTNNHLCTDQRQRDCRLGRYESSSLEWQEELLAHLICPLLLKHRPTKYSKNVGEDKIINIYSQIHTPYYPIHIFLQEMT